MSFFQVLTSVLSAMIGVQKKSNLVRDFEHGKAWHFIVVGLLMVAIFLACVVSFVFLVLSLNI